MVSVCLGPKKERKAKLNWATWKLNVKLLDDEVFVKRVRTALETNDGLESNTYTESWERFKQEAKMSVIERATQIMVHERKQENSLRALLKERTREEIKLPGAFIDDIRSTKTKIEAIEIEKFKGASVRARAERLLARELPTKRALADEKRHARKQDIVEKEYNGVTSKDPNVISDAFEKYYRQLFAHRVPQKKETTEKLESTITVREIEAAIDDLNPGESPGPDGLSAAFYKAFKGET